MELEFIPVEEFYFALTLAMRTLEDLGDAAFVERVRSRLQERFGQASTVAAGKQNTFNYVFRVKGVDNSPAPQLMLSIADWQGKIRLSSDYGWTLDAQRKTIRTEKFGDRSQFCQQVKAHLAQWLELPEFLEA
ncbi:MULTISPECIES: hypothetical protein [unclassified Thermosynechococcus]|uniref:hypothetical protein n=1 Tax=unclassified Thermosynechococcus TaxID=2622553 RepID=UPI00197F88A6|nr:MULTISPECIES: hypothetical protein [unclassified Thermosynechococcus]MDR7898177.1 hypothetical protein [Thermosynechococcus sp. JY1332]MDR7922498.1 hypothetical protein [Thermosynechococcus sp. HY213]MDR7993410.1 hypothetical protein [Thermosynechococcus sp. TG252]QSF50496.1 hypothetical protein JW907_08230 [Thermosynechococcus sp. TA-1]WNC34147.1 hypothetical protein RHH79_08185 [Thermosynechococcus sp. PKX91]